MDEHRFTVLGGEAETIANRLEEAYADDLSLEAALTVAAKALAGPDRQLEAGELEVAVLARGSGRRAFRRLDDEQVSQSLG
jgi:proteasome alpha subunit